MVNKIQPDWAERLLYEFGLGYFSQLEAAEKVFSGFMNIITTKVFSECMTAFNVSVDYLYGLPYNVDQTGVLMDAAKIILNPWHREGNITAQRNFQLLYGYEGSFLEHNIFELWFDLPSISAVKALQIAKSQGIQIFDINSSNINQILPLLEVSEDVKNEIINAVNQGFEVKISQREIQFYDWKGVGYIIRDPQTKAGAYKISGGYAGGGSGEERYVRVGDVVTIIDINKSRASVVRGYSTSGIQELLFEVECLVAWFFIFAMGYFPSYIRTYSEEQFMEELKKPYNQIFHYTGHSDEYGNSLILYRDATSEEVVGRIQIRNADKPEYIFVFINGCLGNKIAQEFGSKSGLAWERMVTDFEAVYANYFFYGYTQTGLNVSQAYNLTRVTLGPFSVGFLMFGDGSVVLKKKW